MSEALILEWDLADRLGKALRYGRVSPSEMATYLGVHRNTVGNYLHGRGTRGPTLAVLRAWAERCGVPYEWLVTGDMQDSSRSGWTDILPGQQFLFAA